MILHLQPESASLLTVNGACADDLHEHLGAVLVEPGDRDPVGSRITGSNLSLALQCNHPVGEQPGPAAVREHPRPPALQFGRERLPRVAEHGGRGLQQPLAAGVASDAHPLEGQHLLHHLPALIHPAEDVGLGHPQIVEEDLVEVMRARSCDGSAGPRFPGRTSAPGRP